MATNWSFANARRAKLKAQDTIAHLEARIERLEGQIRDLGADPVP